MRHARPDKHRVAHLPGFARIPARLSVGGAFGAHQPVFVVQHLPVPKGDLEQCFPLVHAHHDTPKGEPMTTTGDGRTLPWRFLGRQVRPYALAELDAAIRDAEV